VFAKQALYAGLIVGAFAAVAAGVHAATPPAHAHFEPDSSLMVSTRDELRVCVDTQGPVDASRLEQRLSSGLGLVRQHPQWGVARYGERVPALERECAARLPAEITKGTVVGPGVTDDPSPYRTVIIVLDEASAKRYLGAQPAVLVPYELMKVSDHVAVTVTQAVVVREGFVGAPAFTAEYLTPALGLEPTSR
jgi:hypothetical protein